MPPLNAAKRLVRTILSRSGFEVRRLGFGMSLDEDLKKLLAAEPSPIIVDVGANVGQTARRFKKLFPQSKIFSYEPSASLFPLLQQNVTQLDGVVPINVALGASSKTGTLYISGSMERTNSLLAPIEAEGGPPVSRVDSVLIETLDSSLKGYAVDAIDLLKIDTEGYDLEVLRGAMGLLDTGAIKVIQCEAWFVEHYAGQPQFGPLYDFLTGYGYKLAGLYAPRYKESPVLRLCEALFIQQRSQ